MLVVKKSPKMLVPKTYKIIFFKLKNEQVVAAGGESVLTKKGHDLTIFYGT